MYKAAALGLLAIIAGFSFIDLGLGKTTGDESNHSVASLPKEWSKFVPFTGKFTVYLPRTPKYAIDIVDVPNTEAKRWYEMYASEEVNGTVFLVNLISYPTGFDLSNTQGILHNIVNEITSSNINNKVLEVKDGTFDGRKSVFFHIQNEAIEVKGVAFLAGITVYQLTYTALRDNFSESEYQNFINSFELIKPVEPQGQS